MRVTARLASRWLSGRVPSVRRKTTDADLETAYCAEVLAATYQAMGLLPGRHEPGWYDPGHFWSGDHQAFDSEAGSPQASGSKGNRTA